MTCPACGSDLREGRATIEKSALGVLVFGVPHRLFFRSAGQAEKEILTTGQETGAFRCESCGLVVLTAAKG